LIGDRIHSNEEDISKWGTILCQIRDIMRFSASIVL